MELTEKEKALVLKLRAEEVEKNKSFVRKVGYLKENLYRNDREIYTKYQNFYSETEKKAAVEEYESDFYLVAEAGAKVYLQLTQQPGSYAKDKYPFWMVSKYEAFHETWGERYLRDITVAEEDGR